MPSGGSSPGQAHQVTNQAPPLQDYDAYAADPVLRAAITAFDAGWADERLHEAGRTVGAAETIEMARLANRHGPELRSHDRYGNRLDQIEFHPAWHALMARAIGQETHALAWNQPGPGAQVARPPCNISGMAARAASAARSR